MCTPVIWTHISPDLDSVFSCCAVKAFIPGFSESPVRFVPADWDGQEMDPGDIAIDIDAGGKGIKGHQDHDGTVHSCFRALMEKYAHRDINNALLMLIKFVDFHDSRGNVPFNMLNDAVPNQIKAILNIASLNFTLRALQEYHKDDETVFERIWEVFQGTIRIKMSHLEARRKYSEIVSLLPSGKIAIINQPGDLRFAHLFPDSVIFYIYVDGNNLGISRMAGKIPANHPKIRELIEFAGEKSSWFATPDGRLYCHGSRKSPQENASCVDPMELAKALDRLL